jgi:hypothetical protein
VVTIVEKIPCDDAAAFLARLKLSEDNWGPLTDYSSPWIFRGHSDAGWPLQPRAWRRDGQEILRPLLERYRRQVESELPAWTTINPKWRKDLVVEHTSQVLAEVNAVVDFAELADRLGHPVAEWPDRMRPSDVLTHRTSVAAPESFEPGRAFALAQHHSVPTRLLDWTRKPVVAAFFAAEGVEDLRAKGKDPAAIAVWALDTRAQSLALDLKIQTVPRYQFSFLHAQDGLFTWDHSGDAYFFDHGEWPRLEEMLEPKPFEVPPVRMVTLPADEADKVLRLLWVDRVSRAHLMPTHDNITAALKRRWSWP